MFMTKKAQLVIEKAASTPLTREGIEEFYGWLVGFQDGWFFGEQFPHPEYHLSKRKSPRQARLITIDGICGAGKDTQIELLAKRIHTSQTTKGYCRKKVTKRGSPFREGLVAYWKEHSIVRDNRIEIPLLWAGRKYFIEEILIPELAKAPGVVLQNRSYLSDVVFMTRNPTNLDKHLRLCCFDPAPDLAIVLTMKPGVAFDRVRSRAHSTGRSIQPQEQLPLMEHTAALYQIILNRRPEIAVSVYADGCPEEVHARIWQLVEPILFEVSKVFNS